MAFGDIIRQAASPSSTAGGMGGTATKIWHCDSFSDKIYELSVADFSVVRQANSPSEIPQCIGGSNTKIWHGDRNLDRLYELSTTDFSVVRFEASGIYPAGIGGDASTIWHCDTVAVEELQKLSITDFSIIRTGASTDAFPYGIGGITGAVIGCGTGNDRIYGLSASDFSVQVWAASPGADPRGIGGTNLKIWHCDFNLQKVYELDTGLGAPVAPTAPTVLLCNGQANPVDVMPAYFSGIYNDPNLWDIADYYRLQVNKTSDFTGQMLWDSGKTAMSDVNEGDRCANIDYNGQALSLNKIQYYWRIKFWDDEGQEGAWSAIGATHFTMAGSGAGEMGAGPWEEDVLYAPSGGPWNGAFGIGEVEIPRRSGNWTTLADMMRIHTSVNKNPLDAVEIAQAEVTCCNISKSFNSFEEASDWYKQLEGFAVRLTVACMVAGSPVSRGLFTGIISSVDTRRSSQTAEMKIIDFLDYFGRVTIEQTPVWENISLTQLYKNLVELAFSDWVEGVDYFVEDLGDITVQAISYENLNLLAELKHIAECRGMRIFTDVNGKLVCRSRSMEGDPWDIKHDYNLEDVSERRDIDHVRNWIIVHARPHEVAYEPVETFEIGEGGDAYVPTMGPDVTPSGKIAAFTATPGFEKIDLTWFNPTGADFELVHIRRSIHGYPVNVDDGVKLYEGAGEFKSHTNLTTPSRRYYSAFVKDTTGNWSEAAHCSGVPGAGGDTWEDDTGTSPVSAFSGTPGNGQISLTWRNPDVSNFELVRIRRSTSTYPATPTSGSAVYEGTSETKLDTGLTNGTRYYYSAFAKNTAGKWSRATFGTCIPGGIKKAIGSQTILGAGCLTKYDGYGQPAVFPTCGFAGTDFSIYKDLRFGSGGQTADWLRFKHRWDIQVDASLSWSSNQKHEIGEDADLALGFSKTIGGILAVTVTKVGLTSSSVRVRYSATYVGGRAHKISFRNKLILMG